MDSPDVNLLYSMYHTRKKHNKMGHLQLDLQLVLDEPLKHPCKALIPVFMDSQSNHSRLSDSPLSHSICTH